MSMRPIQFILILILISIVALYFSRLRSSVLGRLLVLMFGVAGIVMASAPDWTTKLANVIGVGRGVDLLFYLALIAIVFICLLLYSKIRDLETSYANLIRTISIDQAKIPSNSNQGRPDTK